jgi:hypothetical protein
MHTNSLTALALRVLLVCLALTATSGCRIDALTRGEAQEALEESSIDSQASALTSASIELSTEFTIGEAAANAAQRIRDFVRSQLPCASVALQDSTLDIVYGASGACTFRGHAFSGSHTIEVVRNEQRSVIVTHVWDGLSNGRISVTGEAEVTWTLDDPSRRVVHDLTWTRLSDGREGRGTGDRTQRPLAGGLVEGFSVDGARTWDGARGHWELDVDGIEMRWIDPLPQAGSLALTTPEDKLITLEFERIDADSIGVTASGGDRSIEFSVNKLGAIERR